MMYVYDKDNPRSEDYGEGFADGYARAKEDINVNAEIKEAMDNAAGTLLNRFFDELDSYAETDNRIEINTVRDMFANHVAFTLGLFKPAE